MAKRKVHVAPPPAPGRVGLPVRDQRRGEGVGAGARGRAGRIWWGIDDEKRTVWMTDCSVGHPKATE